MTVIGSYRRQSHEAIFNHSNLKTALASNLSSVPPDGVILGDQTIS